MNINEAIEQLKYYQNKPYVPTVRKVCDIAMETIEALQQENERLADETIRLMKENAKNSNKKGRAGEGAETGEGCYQRI